MFNVLIFFNVIICRIKIWESALFIVVLLQVLENLSEEYYRVGSIIAYALIKNSQLQSILTNDFIENNAQLSSDKCIIDKLQ